MAKNGERPVRTPREDWRAVAQALNARMTARRVGQQELADQAGVSVATLRVLQHGAGRRRVQDATLAAVCRALDWPADHLLSILLGQPAPGAASAASASAEDSFAALVEGQAEILAVLLRIERQIDGIARHLTSAY
ncbi:helix-turn-helix domain-containing protein [Pseudofrankia sp. BMG5.37]|uniref:helix-turn-helix domain-containing protein n=1 Tax=Pseudofrankia sp. BMG5.37 TaxID=3050035 RepID=UPI002893905D|nr:helix-turn-helix domain-containing protein [Pseudofrankia sp. BMG5.37]MDT3444271.1 helix-turn-helix domain-containing protein [Pseudofrankia sp. BMG5.37]